MSVNTTLHYNTVKYAHLLVNLKIDVVLHKTLNVYVEACACGKYINSKTRSSYRIHEQKHVKSAFQKLGEFHMP